MTIINRFLGIWVYCFVFIWAKMQLYTEAGVQATLRFGACKHVEAGRPLFVVVSPLELLQLKCAHVFRLGATTGLRLSVQLMPQLLSDLTVAATIQSANTAAQTCD